MNKTKFIFRQITDHNISNYDTIAIYPEMEGDCGSVGYYVYSGFGHTKLKYANYNELISKSIPINDKHIEYNELKLDLESMGYIVEEITEEKNVALVS